LEKAPESNFGAFLMPERGKIFEKPTNKLKFVLLNKEVGLQIVMKNRWQANL
jgi:hypothetical protein